MFNEATDGVKRFSFTLFSFICWHRVIADSSTHLLSTKPTCGTACSPLEPVTPTTRYGARWSRANLSFCFVSFAKFSTVIWRRLVASSCPRLITSFTTCHTALRPFAPSTPIAIDWTRWQMSVFCFGVISVARLSTKRFFWIVTASESSRSSTSATSD